jgi:hypothetical protein
MVIGAAPLLPGEFGRCGAVMSRAQSAGTYASQEIANMLGILQGSIH